MVVHVQHANVYALYVVHYEVCQCNHGACSMLNIYTIYMLVSQNDILDIKPIRHASISTLGMQLYLWLVS